jgi:hypothetical protein
LCQAADVLAVPLAAVALASTPRCNLAAGKAAVKRSHLTIPASQSASSEPYRVSPDEIDGTICVKLPGGKVAMVVTVGSGGTAGDIDWAVYVSTAKGYKLSLVRGGYKLGLQRVGSDIVETDPVYRKKDPNCCPSGGFVHTRWHWDGRQFAVVRTWHDSKYQE